MVDRLPSTLANRGIRSVSDNLPAGKTVRLGSEFIRFFRAEAARALSVPAPAQATVGGRSKRQ